VTRRQNGYRGIKSAIAQTTGSWGNSGVDKDFVKIIYDLLPGFFAAWIFYGLTAHPRREVFERVIQALIFTGIIRVFTSCFAWCCLFVGRLFVLGRWTDKLEFGWSMVFAGIFGLTISTLANRDVLHRWLREGKWVNRFKITKKNSYPSEWFSAFQREDRVISKCCGRPRQVKRRFVLRRRTRCRRSGPLVFRSRSVFSSATRPCV
jgi:hypothetical protein